MIDRDFIKMIGRLKYLEHTSDAIFKFLHDTFDHHLPGIGMSKTEYVEGIANLLSSETSTVMQYKMSIKEDILRAIDSFLSASKQIKNVTSCLRRMEASAHLQETPQMILGMVAWALLIGQQVLSSVFLLL